MGGPYISYLRVSTARQGQSGLGLDAQRESVARFLQDDARALAAEFVEIESGGKSEKDRPQLAAALAACRKQKAMLIVAKLNRLARDTKLILALVDSGIKVRFVDFPDTPDGAAGRFMLTMLAAVAEFERRRRSEQTKGSLAAAKARGVKLGEAGPANLRRNVEERQAKAQAFAAKLQPVLNGFKAAGLTQQDQVIQLNALGIAAPRGGLWTRMQLWRVALRTNA